MSNVFSCIRDGRLAHYAARDDGVVFLRKQVRLPNGVTSWSKWAIDPHYTLDRLQSMCATKEVFPIDLAVRLPKERVA